MTSATALGVLEELNCARVLYRNTADRTNCSSEANVRAGAVRRGTVSSMGNGGEAGR